MSQQTAPFLEGKYGWNFGESGWNTGMDENILKFSFMFDRNLDSITASLPSAVNGQAHYLTTDNRIYFAVGTTYFSTPAPKWATLVLRTSGDTYQFNGTSLVQIDSPAGIDSRLDALEVTASNLGTAAFEDIEFFATQAELDVVEAEGQAYTDSLRSDLAASPTGGSLVGYKTGKVDDIPELFVANTTGTGNLWIGDAPPAKIHRMLDRVFIGDATDNDGANPAGTTSWLGVSPQPGLGWMERNATAASYATKGAIGFVGAAHTSGMTSGAALGLIGVGVNDNETNAVPVWGLYLDAKSYAGALAATFGCELEVANLGTYVGDYSADPRKTIGLDIGAGADPAVNGTTDSVTFGLRFINNGANFGVGISFGSTALRTFVDAEGLNYFRAAVLRNSQAIAWEGTGGELLGKVWNTCTAESNAVSIHLASNNILLKGAAGARAAQFSHITNAVNYPLVSNSVTGVGPSYSVAGTDTDIDLRLVPKGAGLVRFGTFTASGDVAIIGSVSIKDTGGTTRKVAVVA